MLNRGAWRLSWLSCYSITSSRLTFVYCLLFSPLCGITSEKISHFLRCTFSQTIPVHVFARSCGWRLRGNRSRITPLCHVRCGGRLSWGKCCISTGIRACRLCPSTCGIDAGRRSLQYSQCLHPPAPPHPLLTDKSHAPPG